MKILITGGAGFIGSNAVRGALAAGHEVIVLDNFATGRRENLSDLMGDIELLERDIRSLSTLKSTLRGVDAVLHFAALPSVPFSFAKPAETHAVNATGTLNLLIAARDAGVERIVLSSSSSVYGNAKTLPVTEDMPFGPLSPYAAQKTMKEQYGRIFQDQYDMNVFALRYFNVFGPRQNPNSQYAAVIPNFITALKNGEQPTVYGDGEQSRSMVYIDDVVRANLLCCSVDASGCAFNIAGQTPVTVNELARVIGEKLGSSIEPRHIEARAGDIRHSAADLSRAKKILGWQPEVSLADGLARTVNFFTSEKEDITA